MTVTAQRGYIGFHVQSGKLGSTDITTSNYFGSTAWDRHRATMFDLGPIEMIDTLPPEIGAGLFPITSYKNGAYAAGAVSLEARLAGSLGDLLKACASTTVSSVASGVGAYLHTFAPATADHTLMSWLSMKKYLPAASGGTAKTEFMVDCVVPQAVFTVPQMGPMRADFNFVGRKFVGWDGDYTGGSTGGTNNAYESGLSLGISRLGSVLLDSSILPASACTFVGATITLTNTFTTPQQEMIIGAQYPDDFAVLTRGAQVTLTYKWADSALYDTLRYGTGVEFRSDVVFGSVDVKTQSAGPISGSNAAKFMYEFYAPYVGWQMANPRLAAAEAIFVDVIGTVYDKEDGSAPWQMKLLNTATSY